MIDLLHWVRPQCVPSTPILITRIGYNLWIASSYFRIPHYLDRIMRRSGGPPMVTGGALRGSAAFVLSCGIYHVFSVAQLFFPGLDWPTAAWGLWTGAISAWTARRLHSRESVIISTIIDARTLADRVAS